MGGVRHGIAIQRAHERRIKPLQTVVHQDAWGVTVVVEHEHVSEETSKRLNHTNLEVGERNQTEVDEAVRLRVARRAVHNVSLLFFVSHGNGRNHIRTKINAQNKHGGQRQRQLGGDVAQEGGNFRNVGRQRVRDGLLQVVKNETTFLNAIDNRGKVIVHENHISSFLRDILTSNTHGNTDVTLLERRSVVHTVTGDGDNFTAALAVFDNQKLVSRRHASPDNLVVVKRPVPFGALFNRVGNFHPAADVVTLDDGGAARVQVFLGDNVHLLGNRRGGDRVITSDHVNLDASTVALRDGFRDTFARRINQRHETDKREVIHREVWLRLLGELEVILEAREFLVRKAKHAFTATTEIFVGFGVRFFKRSVLITDLALGEVRGALVQYALRSPLQHEERRASTRLLVNGKLPLVRGVELDFEQLRVLRTSFQSIVERLNQLEQTLFRSVTRRRLLENVEEWVLHFSLQVNEGAIFVLREVLSVVTQRRHLKKALERGRILVVERLAIRGSARLRDDREVRNVLTSRAKVNLLINPRVLDSHTVLRERTGLIRRNNGGGTKRFDSFEVLHENVLSVHALGGQRQGHGDGREETFGDVGDNDTNHENYVLNNGGTVGNTNNEENHTERNGNARDELDELFDLLGNR